MGISNRARTLEKKALALLQGWLTDEAPWAPEVPVSGRQHTHPQIVERLKEVRDAHAKVRTQKALHRAALRTRNAALNKQAALLTSLTEIVRQQCGPDLKRLALYGLTPVKRRGKLTSEQQVIAKDREAKTRRVRGIKGSRQRRAISAVPKPIVQILTPEEG